MGIIMAAAYRQSLTVNVPSPFDKNTPDAPWWWDHVASRAHELALAGFTAVLLPPVSKTASGAYPDSDGYGVFDPHDSGSKEQFGSKETRFGSREQLQRCIAILRANGIDAYADVVHHQRYGGNNGTYEYLGADGKTKNGRWPLNPGCFVGDPPRRPRDPIAGPVSDDFSFGDECVYIRAESPKYMIDGAIAWGNWLTRSFGIKGYRIDDTKGLAVEFVSKWANSESMAGNFCVGEYFSGASNDLDWWVWNSGMNGRASTYDFDFHFSIQEICNNGSRADMSQLQYRGYFRRSPMSAVTFVESGDTAVDGFATIVFSKTLAYAYQLTSEGYPQVFWQDYMPLSEGCYGLAPWIQNLAWIHENLAFGTTWTRHADYQTYVYERQGHPGLLVGLNNDLWNGWKTVTVQTSFGANVQLHDYTGHAGDVWTDNNGMVTIGIPENDNGQGYVAYSRTGYGQPFTAKHEAITQSFYGADDLDIPAATNGTVTVGRIWCDAGTDIAWTSDIHRDHGISVSVTDAAGNATLKPDAVGWYTISVTGAGLAESVPFELEVTYTAPQTLAL